MNPDTPQWVKSRLKVTEKKPKCGPTHGICRCFLQKIIELEAEVSELRLANAKEEAKIQDTGD